jgi:type IV secretory pathway VirB3-like protein
LVDGRAAVGADTIKTRMPAPLHRFLTSPGRFALLMLGVMVVGLGLDHFATLGQQMLLAACTWLILIVACIPLSPEQRARTAVVVLVATIGEIIGSIIWGAYTYRLGNLPLFVPPGHGLVYLTGLRISQTEWVGRNRRAFLTVAVTMIAGWGILGLTGLLGRHDVAGAVGCATLIAFIIGTRRAATLYAGVFFAVAVLEIYGTAIGTWRWAETVPGLGVPNGNPPSGAASGYVLFDICALAFGMALLGLVRRLRGRPLPQPAPEVT